MFSRFSKSMLGALALLAIPAVAFAQSSPGLTYGQVPTAAQWNSYFAKKQDVLGYTPVNKAGDFMLGRLITAQSSSAASGLNIQVGAAPSSPVDGDVWLTTAGLFVRAGGVTYGPIGGVLPCPSMPQLTGDVTTPGASCVTTLATVPVTKGGTNRTTLTANAVITGNGNSAPNMIAPSAASTRNYLGSSLSGAPTYTQVNFTELAGSLDPSQCPAGVGGTFGCVFTPANPPVAGNYLTGYNGTSWSSGQVQFSQLGGSANLATQVSGILAGANGGSANGFFAVSGPASSLKTFTFPNASANVLTDNAAVTVAQGGTGGTTAAAARTNLGVTGTGADTTYAFRANNLSDLGNAATALANLGGAPLASPTFTGTVNVAALTASGIIKQSGGGGGAIRLDGSAATSRGIEYLTGGVARWIVQANATAESGSNIGSDFTIQNYADGGSNIGTPLSIARSTGITTLFGLTLTNPLALAYGGCGGTSASTCLAAIAGAPLASPALTGTPTAPTASTGDNSTTIATTAFVKAQAYAPLASPSFTGTVNSSGSISLANSAAFFWSSRAAIYSPADSFVKLANNANTDFTALQFGGTTASFPEIKKNGAALNFRLADDSADASVTAATASPGTNTTQVATTAFVTAAVASGGVVSSVFGRTGAVVAANNDYNFNQLAGSLASAQCPSAVSGGSKGCILAPATPPAPHVFLYDYNGTNWLSKQPDWSDLTNVPSTLSGYGLFSIALTSANFAAQGTATQVLHGSAAGNLSWSAVSLTADVTGLLPNANLANSSVVINGSTVALGSSKTLALASADFVNQGGVNQVLHGNAAGNPSWGAVDLTTAQVVNALGVGNGGLGVVTLASNGILYGNGASAVNVLAVNATATKKYLQQVSSGAPSWQQIAFADLSGTVDLSSQVANILAAANGGTGNGFFQISGPASSAKTYTVPNVSANLLTDQSASNLSQDIYFSGDISPPQITADQNNYAPTGFSTASVLRLSTDASRNLSGMAGGSDGRVIIIENVGSNPLVINNQGGGSTAANRFQIGADTTLSQDQAIAVKYDSTDTRWRLISSPCTPAVGGTFGCVFTPANPPVAGNYLTGYNGTAWSSGQVQFSQLGGTADLTSQVANILAGANGGTGNGFTAFSGPATSLKTFTLPNASATILTSNALVTAAQGGTNNGFFQVSGPATSTKTFTFPNASANVLTDNALVTVPQGGIGVGTLASNGVLYGGGTGAVNALAVNSTATLRYLSQNNSNAPSWVSPTFAALTDTLDMANGTGQIANNLGTNHGGTGAADIITAMSNLGRPTQASTPQLDKVNTTMANVGNLSITTTSGKQYYFNAMLVVNLDTTSGGRFRMGGSSTATSAQYYGTFTCDGTGVITRQRFTDIGATVMNITGCTAGSMELRGVVTINAGGTFMPQFALSTGTTTGSVLAQSPIEWQQLN